MSLRLSVVVALLLAGASGHAQQLPTPNSQPPTQELRQQLETVQRLLQATIDRLPAGVSVPQGGDLQAALEAGGMVNLPRGGTFTAARFSVTTPGTTVNCNGALLVGTTGPAVHIRPGSHDTKLLGCSYASSWPGPVIQCGDNDAGTQGTRDKVPQRILIDSPVIATHRGKVGIQVNCSGTITNPQIAYVYATTLQDSQAINILSTCGPVSVLGGHLQAGSEVLMVGGDRRQISDCPEGVVADVLIDDVTMTRPPEWQDKVKTAPKNTLELKAGVRVTVRRSRILRSYRSRLGEATQDGSGIVITPRNGQFIRDVLIENNVIDQVAQGAQLMGRDAPSTPLTTGVRFTGNTWTIDGPTFNGRGVLALVVGGMPAVTWENETVVMTGTALFLVDSTEPVGPFTVTGSRMTAGRLVCAAPGVNFCGPTPAGRVPFTLIATGNTFADAPSQFKAGYPSNVYLTRVQLDQLIATPAK